MGRNGKIPRNLQDREFFESKYKNDRTFNSFYMRLVSLAISMWDWQNMPDTVNKRYLETRLFSRGSMVFFKDETLGFLALPFVNTGPVDIYNEPTKIMAFSSTGYTKDLENNKDCVIIWNNELHMPMQPTIEEFAWRLANVQRTMDVNVHVQKTPLMLLCDEDQRLTLLNLYKNYAGNEPVIFADKKLSPDSIKVLKTDAPYMASSLYDLESQIWNEALTYLGITNVNVVKKERLISDEAVRNQGGTIAQRHARMNMRKDAVERINKMFNLDINIEFQSDIAMRDYRTALGEFTDQANQEIAEVEEREGKE